MKSIRPTGNQAMNPRRKETSIAYSWGTTEEEERRAFPCDSYLADANDILFRAVTVHASAPVIFEWLCQLRVAPLRYDWIDNFGRRSPRQIDPALQELQAGQRFMQIFALCEFHRNEHVTLTTCSTRAERLFGSLAVSYFISKPPKGAYGLIVKLRVRRSRGFLTGLWSPLLPWGDLVMMRKQLLTLKRLAERSN